MGYRSGRRHVHGPVLHGMDLAVAAALLSGAVSAEPPAVAADPAFRYRAGTGPAFRTLEEAISDLQHRDRHCGSPIPWGVVCTWSHVRPANPTIIVNGRPSTWVGVRTMVDSRWDPPATWVTTDAATGISMSVECDAGFTLRRERSDAARTEYACVRPKAARAAAAGASPSFCPAASTWTPTC